MGGYRLYLAILFTFTSFSFVNASSYMSLELQGVWGESDFSKVTPNLEDINLEPTATNTNYNSPYDVWDAYCSMRKFPVKTPIPQQNDFFTLNFFDKKIGCGYYYAQGKEDTLCTLYITKFDSPYLIQDVVRCALVPVMTEKFTFVFLPDLKDFDRKKGKLILGFSNPVRALQKALKSVGLSAHEDSPVHLYKGTTVKKRFRATM